MTPKVSVIVPIYNAENYIKRCVRSLLGQSLEDMEFLFIDDCTPDNSMNELRKVIEEFPHRKSQIVIHKMSSNSGQAAVRKWGILHASGEYSIHCDSDDWVPTDAYEKLYNIAKVHDLDIVFHDYFVTDGNSSISKSLGIAKKTKEQVLSQLISGEIKASLCFTLIRNKLYNNRKFTFPLGDMTEDCTMIVQLFFLSELFGYLNEPLYYYYQNPASITHRITIESCERKFESCYNNSELMESFIESNSENKFLEEFLVRRLSTVNQLLPVIYKYKFYKKWRDTYPQLVKNSLLSKKLPCSKKKKILLTYIGLYPLYRILKGYKFATK